MRAMMFGVLAAEHYLCGMKDSVLTSGGRSGGAAAAVTGLSVLLPEYNTCCVPLVRALVRQCGAVTGLDYEIIVYDDASTDRRAVQANEEIRGLARCSFVAAKQNRGSGAARNALALMAEHRWLLFLDCDVKLTHDDFIRRYIDAANTYGPGVVINGGVEIGHGGTPLPNLRYAYEKGEERAHGAAARAKHPHHAFRTTNFMADRDVMLAHPFDERLRRYEDVLFGKDLCDSSVDIVHIDNPVLMDTFEGNDEFIRKVERNIDVLFAFRQRLKGYSPLLALADCLPVRLCLPAIAAWHKRCGGRLRHTLTSSTPRTILLRVYQVGYYARLAGGRRNRHTTINA